MAESGPCWVRAIILLQSNPCRGHCPDRAIHAVGVVLLFLIFGQRVLGCIFDDRRRRGNSEVGGTWRVLRSSPAEIGVVEFSHDGVHLCCVVVVVDEAEACLDQRDQQLHRALTGQSAISPEMALRSEAVIGSTADHWPRLQAAYNLAKVRQRAPEITTSLRRLRPD